MYENENYEDEQEAYDEEIDEILLEYRRKQIVETMTGPVVSLIGHIALLFIAFAVIVFTVKEDITVVAETVVIPVVDIPPIEEIEETLKEEVIEDAPVTDSESPSTEVGEEVSPVDFDDNTPETDDDNADTHEFCDVALSNSPMTYAGNRGGSRNAGRAGLISKYGGSHGKLGQDRLNKALRWLQRVQNTDGSWGSKEVRKPGLTGLALLTFLGHGETPKSKHFGATVEAAIKWLANYGADCYELDKSISKYNGGYAHSIATYALCEAYAMTKIASLKVPMDNCIKKIIEGQQANGGWDYKYEKGPRTDTSITGWAMQALKAGKMAGSHVNGIIPAMIKSVRYIRTKTYKPGNKHPYLYAMGDKKGPKEGKNMAGVAALGLLLLAKTADNEEGKLGMFEKKQLSDEEKIDHIKTALKVISTKRLDDYESVLEGKNFLTVAGNSLYGWYYDTQVVFNTQNKPGTVWKKWSQVFQKVLIENQNSEGYWETKGGHGDGSTTPGRVYTTCLAALQLEVFYRYLPSFSIETTTVTNNKRTSKREELIED